MTISIRVRIKTGLLGLLLSSLVLSGCTTSEGNPSSALKADQSATPAPAQRPALRMPGQPIVSINSIKADQVDETVAIAGSVTQRVALLEGWLYQVQDESDRLWVLTSGAEPEVGQSAIVEGIVRYEAIVVDGLDAGELYLEEQAYVPDEG
ncbi:MAG: hypothetical protein WBB01_14660 [Phormidesmis sp.]